MAVFNCNCKRDCTLIAVIASLILGVVTAFLQITAVITVTTAFLWVALGIAVVYLGILLVTTALARREACKPCVCSSLKTVLTGILGAILFAVVLLAVGITATSVISAILIGLLVASLTLTFAGAACLVLCLTDCEN